MFLLKKIYILPLAAQVILNRHSWAIRNQTKLMKNFYVILKGNCGEQRLASVKTHSDFIKSLCPTLVKEINFS